MLLGAGVISGKKINVLPAYKAPEAPAVEETPAEAAPAAEVVETAAETPAEAPVAEAETKTE